MGTEITDVAFAIGITKLEPVKLNNPLMGTEISCDIEQLFFWLMFC